MEPDIGGGPPPALTLRQFMWGTARSVVTHCTRDLSSRHYLRDTKYLILRANQWTPARTIHDCRPPRHHYLDYRSVTLGAPLATSSPSILPIPLKHWYLLPIGPPLTR